MKRPKLKACFTSDAQFKKFCRTESFFLRLLELHNQGCLIIVDGEVETGKPFVDGYKVGFTEDRSTTLWVGCEFAKDSKTGEFDIPWVGTTMKEMRERIKVYSKTPVVI